MPEKIPRPPSVWIAQVILFIFGSIWLVAAVWNIYFAVMIATDITRLMASIIPGVIFLAFACFFLLGFWGLTKRKVYGRVIAVLGLSVMLFGSLSSVIFRPSGPMQYYEYQNATQLAGGIFASIVLYGLLALLIGSLAFGKKANAFFSPTETLVSEPPPPPTFDNPI
jgi:hypothetical protein